MILRVEATNKQAKQNKQKTKQKQETMKEDGLRVELRLVFIYNYSLQFVARPFEL